VKDRKLTEIVSDDERSDTFLSVLPKRNKKSEKMFFNTNEDKKDKLKITDMSIIFERQCRKKSRRKT
jgi:hypothetical protein